MSANRGHLSLVADNRGVATPYRTERDREARRTELGIVGHSGGRMLPVPLSVYQPPATTTAAPAERSAWDMMPSDCNPE